MPLDTSKLDLMKEVAATNLNSIPAAKSGDSRAFIEAATSWFGNWWKTRSSWESIAPGYCALVLNHVFAASGIPPGFSEKLLFRDAPDPKLGGHIHVSDFSMSRVFRDQGGHTDADSVCRQLKSLNLGTAPCVLFSPEAGVILVAEQGVAGSIARATLTSFDGNLTVPNVDSLLQSLYDTSLKYYETFPHFWFKPKVFVPIFQAEKLYQNLLYLYLKASTQGTWVVVREDQTNAGRTDLSLNALNPERIYVLEMKVLKSFFYHPEGKAVKKFSIKENEDWANSGIDQVCEYRTAKRAKEAFLLLYDMRQKHKPMTRVESSCTNKSVLFRKYAIFNATARDVRSAKPKRSKTR